jgi:hypothetical protein
MSLAGNHARGSLVSRLRENDGTRAGRHTKSTTPAVTPRQPRQPPRYVIPACRWRGTMRRGLWLPAFAGMTERELVATPSQPRQAPHQVNHARRHAKSTTPAATLRHPRMSLAGNHAKRSLASRLRGNDGTRAGRHTKSTTSGATPSQPRQASRQVNHAGRHDTSSPHVVGGEPCEGVSGFPPSRE